MTADALLARLRDRGVLLMADGGRLTYEAPAGIMTPAAVAAVRQAKPALLALLAVEEQAEALIGAAIAELGLMVPAGAVAWADQHRPDLMQTADQAAREFESSAVAHDLAGVRAGLEAFTAALLEVAREFEAQEGGQ